MSSINSLPNEITAKIFSYLEPKDFHTVTTQVSKRFSNFYIKKSAIFYQIHDLIQYFNKNELFLNTNEKKWNRFNASLIELPLAINGATDNLSKQLVLLTTLTQTFVNSIAIRQFNDIDDMRKLQNFCESLPNTLEAKPLITQNVNFLCYLRTILSNYILEKDLIKITHELNYLPVNQIPFILDLLRNAPGSIDRLANIITDYYLCLTVSDKHCFTKSLYKAYDKNPDPDGDKFWDWIVIIQDTILVDAINNNLREISDTVLKKYVAREGDDESYRQISSDAFYGCIESLVIKNQFELLPNVAEFFSTHNPEIAKQLSPIVDRYTNQANFLDFQQDLPPLKSFIPDFNGSIEEYMPIAVEDDKNFYLKHVTYGLIMGIIAKTASFEHLLPFIVKHQFLPDFVMVPVIKCLMRGFENFDSNENQTHLNQLLEWKSQLIKNDMRDYTAISIDTIYWVYQLKYDDSVTLDTLNSDFYFIHDFLLPAEVIFFLFNKFKNDRMIAQFIDDHLRLYYLSLQIHEQAIFCEKFYKHEKATDEASIFLHDCLASIHEEFSKHPIAHKFKK